MKSGLLRCHHGIVSMVLGLLFLIPTSADDAVAPPPNIIFMMADDMGMGDTSAYQDLVGNSDSQQLHTPNMERLARMGVRFTDAHTPSSRCTATRYGLLTGRYAWRSRLKHWVLFGAQGDPLIEAERPTIASLLRQNGYRTAMVGKWHVGLRYRQSNGQPAAGWEDADLTQPLHDCPVDHGFDFAWYTSRSHGTSGPDAGNRQADASNADESNNSANANASKRRPSAQRQRNNVGPGHLDGRKAIGATGQGKQLVAEGPSAYVLKQLGSRHSDRGLQFLNEQLENPDTSQQPFFLYYACNANHGPYTPDESIGGVAVQGAARSKSGSTMGNRYDFIYENDVALGRLMDWLENTDDPRNPGQTLMHNTLIVFTSDNGAEIKDKSATGPFRSNKGSVYEGGHRIPFLVTWPAGGVGDGDVGTPGQSNSTRLCLTDMYATFAEILGQPLPDLAAGERGAEDSHSMLAAFRGGQFEPAYPLLHNDHSEAKDDRAASAIRMDAPTVDGQPFAGNWKLFFDAGLIRHGVAQPTELYDLSRDPQEQQNLRERKELQSLVEYLTQVAVNHRRSGGHRFAEFNWSDSVHIRFDDGSLASKVDGQSANPLTVSLRSGAQPLTMTLVGTVGDSEAELMFSCKPYGLALSSGKPDYVDQGEAICISFDQDVLLESTAIAADDGSCGGFCKVGQHAALAIYCIDADIDSQDQHGDLSDLGILKAGQTLRLDSRPHHGVESVGAWRLRDLKIRTQLPTQ
ncbi:MAG: arylsulfatase [bacterium]|nr:arylsulfatase [bacterium]